jgi:putative transposase
MNSIDFVSSIRLGVVEENLKLYREIYTASPDALDGYWKRALSLFSVLSEDQQDVFFEIIRQIEVDTVSNVLGVIDGVNSVGGGFVNVRILCGESGEDIGGGLQDIFLEAEEKYAEEKGK